MLTLFSFPNSSDEFWQDVPHPGPTFTTSAYRFPGYERGIYPHGVMAYGRSPPDSDPNFLWTQPSSPIYPPAHEARHPERFAVASPNHNAHTSLDLRGRPLQTDPSYTLFLNHQDPGPMPTVTAVPTTHQPFATLDADRSLMRHDLQEYSSPVSKCLQCRVCIANIDCIDHERFFTCT